MAFNTSRIKVYPKGIPLWLGKQAKLKYNIEKCVLGQCRFVSRKTCKRLKQWVGLAVKLAVWIMMRLRGEGDRKGKLWMLEHFGNFLMAFIL